MVANQSGAAVALHDYLPYGGEIPSGVGGRSSLYGAADQVAEKFTSKERDAETGLDYFGARYFSWAQGRFTSPDDPFGGQNPHNPQSWNLYTYGLNNPLVYSDPTGHEPYVEGVNPENGNICTIGTATPLPNMKEQAAAASKVMANAAIDILNVSVPPLALFPLQRLQPSSTLQANEMQRGQQILNFSLSFRPFGELTLGDLTAQEIAEIQAVVNEAGRPLEAVGSAAKGMRRGVGTNLPIGKGPGTSSDIDYVAPPSSHPYLQPLQGKLPGIDPATGIVPGVHNPYIGPAVRFEPGAEPRYIPMKDTTK